MAAAPFASLLPTLAAGQTRFYWDGNYTDGFPSGMPVPSFPFADKGDMVTVQFRQKWEQALVSYTPPSQSTPMPGQPTLYFFNDTNWSDGGAGVACFERFFGNIPATRTEPESFNYQYQMLVLTVSSSGGDSAGTTGALSVLPLQVDSTVTYEYFLKSDIDSFPLEDPPRYFSPAANLFDVIGSGNLYLSGSFVCSNDAMILAEPDTYGDYEGQIMFRKRRQIPGPTPAFWGTQLNLAQFTISPATATLSQELTVTLTGTRTQWTSATTFAASAGTIGAVTVDAAAQTATFVYTAPTSAQTVRFASIDGAYATNSLTVTAS